MTAASSATVIPRAETLSDQAIISRDGPIRQNQSRPAPTVASSR
jgi:hypothetical protein